MCTHCYGDLVWLGQLGKLYYYRCRDCGAEFGTDAELAADEIDDRPDPLLEEIMEVELIPEGSDEEVW
jgi:hypothetical protein